MSQNGQTESPRIGVVLGAATHVGMQREVNQDSMCSISAPNTATGVAALIAVADGMGGHQGGEVASAMAIEGVVEKFGKTSSFGDNVSDQPEQIRTGLIAIHNDVMSAGNKPETAGMGTTLSLAIVQDNRVLLGHVGDSRVYRLRDQGLSQLTDDHSWVGEEVRQGRMTEAQAAVHPRRNLVLQAIGATPTIEPAIYETDVRVGDRLLICSDGLHGVVADEEIGRITSTLSPVDAVDELVNKANQGGGPDNVSVVIAEIVTIDGTSTLGSTSGMKTITGSAPNQISAMRIATFPIRVIFRSISRLIGL